MAHLDSSFSSFEAFLDPADGAPYTLDGTWAVDLNALNSSGVDGTVVLGISNEPGGNRVLNVSVSASGLTPGQIHPQHIHGVFDEDGNPANSVSPTLEDDADRDGLVEVLEGVPDYGDILLSLIAANGATAMADQNGNLSFIQDYDLSDESNLVSPVTGNQYSVEDLIPLALREVVLHGIDVPDGIGEGTDGEVDGGTNGYTPILPVASGQIAAVPQEEALRLLDVQRAQASDDITLGDGDDTFDGGNGDDVIFGAGGNDLILGRGDDDRIGGGDGQDSLFGGAGDDAVFGGAGDDVVGGASGDDRLFGGADNDAIFGASGDDVIGGGAGDDSQFGGAGFDMIYSAAGNDVAFGSDGSDSIAGGSGDDSLTGGQGKDVIDGDEGNDMIMAGGKDANIANGSDAGASGALTLDDYDNGYAGGSGDDTITAGDGDDIISGDDDSRVSDSANLAFDAGADGSDVIFGGAGNDEIHTGSWADGDQGLGNTQTGMADDVAFGGAGNDILRGAGGNDVLYGGGDDDDIGGGGGDDQAYGGFGADVIAGDDGDDVLGGASGNDTLSGGAGDDDLFGGSGDDMLMGQEGDEFIFGGAGADLFAHDGSASFGTDTIADYNSDEMDVLLFEGAAARSDFSVSFTSDGGDGGSAEDASVSFGGNVLWYLNDASAQDSLFVQTDNDTYDLFA